MTFDLYLDLERTLERAWIQAYLGTIVCKCGGDPVICLLEEAIFVKSQKCPYHVTFDLNLDLEHIVDAGRAGNHRVLVWSRSSHLSGRRSDLRKMFTDGRRTRHDCISS